jgi:hypothetical protein
MDGPLQENPIEATTVRDLFILMLNVKSFCYSISASARPPMML